MICTYLFQLCLGKLKKLLCLKIGGYSSVPTEISYTGASAELRYDQVSLDKWFAISSEPHYSVVLPMFSA